MYLFSLFHILTGSDTTHSFTNKWKHRIHMLHIILYAIVGVHLDCYHVRLFIGYWRSYYAKFEIILLSFALYHMPPAIYIYIYTKFGGQDLGTTFGGPNLGIWTAFGRPHLGDHIWGTNFGGGPNLGTKFGGPHLGDHIWIWGTKFEFGAQIWGTSFVGPHLGPHLRHYIWGTTFGGPHLGDQFWGTTLWDHAWGSHLDHLWLPRPSLAKSECAERWS